MTSNATWGLLSPEEHEFHFNPQRAFPNFASHRERRAPANEAAISNLRREADLAYGPHERHRLDIYRAPRPDAPIHIYFHGGYWRANSKDDYAWLAEPLVQRGFTVVIPNYELCPASTLDGTVDSALAAIQWVAQNGAAHGGDPSSITLSGHSAGAHLCAAALAVDWSARGLDPAFLKATIMISGVFEPSAAMRTTVNNDLRLTPEIAARHDYERARPLSNACAHLFVGGREPWRWIEQTFRYSHHLRRHGRDPEAHVLPGYDHFDIIDEFAVEGGPLVRAIMRYA